MVKVSLEPPPSSRISNAQRVRKVLATVSVAGVLIAAGAGFWIGRRTAPQRNASASAAPAGGLALAPGRAAAGAGAQPVGTAVAAPSPATAGTPSPPIPAPAPAGGPGRATDAASPDARSPRHVVAVVAGPLEEAIASAVPAADRPIASELTQVVNRLLVWSLLVARDGRRGDRVEILYEPPSPAAPGLPPSGDPVILALRYASQKLGKTFAAYRFQAPSAPFARYYRADGSELEERLVDGPIAEYEQVTSLLKDGRRHKGVDFKTPVGSPVTSTFDGVIERRNWNFAGNGNSLDLRDRATGRHAIFLHLDVLPKDMQPGRAVRKGERIASSGNTGHTTAPHLHYQLEAPDGRILDPFEIHATRRAAIGGEQLALFQVERARLDTALGAPPAQAPVAASAPAPARGRRAAAAR